VEALFLDVLVAGANDEGDAFELGVFLTDLQDLAAIEWHEDVQKDHVDFLIAFLEKFQRLFAVIGFEDVEILLQDGGKDLDIDLLIVDDQNGPLDEEVAAIRVSDLLFFAHVVFFIIKCWKIFCSRNKKESRPKGRLQKT
jgi:hypothetical protein